MKGICLVCNSPFKGRSDKKFCSNHCRSHFHNTKHSLNLPYISYVNKILFHNRMQLEKILKHKKVVSLEELKDVNFNPDLFTSSAIQVNGIPIKFYYDLGLKKKSRDLYKIILKE